MIVSGVVALTLSPMMGAKLLRAGDTERGFAGWINRRFETVRQTYIRALAATLRYQPVVVVLWLIVAALIVPFYMFSQRELAPAEDQGVVFSVVQAAPNSTIEQTKLFTQQIYEVYRSFPETSSTFQLTFPTGGFGGMVTKPWSERSKTAQQLLMEAMGPLSRIPGVHAIPLTPPPLPGGGDGKAVRPRGAVGVEPPHREHERRVVGRTEAHDPPRPVAHARVQIVELGRLTGDVAERARPDLEPLDLLRREVQARDTSVLIIDGWSAIEETAASNREFKKFIHALQAQALIATVRCSC